MPVVPVIPVVSAPVAQPPQGVLTPRLLWAQGWYKGSEDDPTEDMAWFPGLDERRLRGRDGRMLISVEFQAALRSASRVLIMDPHFDLAAGVIPLCDALMFSSATSVRINTRQSEEDDKIAEYLEILRQVLQGKQPKDTIAVVEIRHNAVKIPLATKDLELHDRFAIVNNELWHFGSTCGGSYQGMTAHSRGWDVMKTKAEAYFEEIWG